ncbi:hypothetical protein BCF33_2789 [Hasllibacter halocynthiae]|uniref:Ribonuclease VapC n=1 Tax=Hasllibacter halocynthiae TaxID=595589 RepID=A0A2T0WZH6_9RHOB|nr:type II toxin-antitoxin system VapC family toxin [Hasllibacter halocynthiae]PRY92089.1 hypothetical protein BCF33_2789 [Hasllibacter halocynthiae]
MILADTSVWIDHLRGGDAALAEALGRGRIAGHPVVAAELALGSLKDRALVLELLDGLPRLPVAAPDELRALIERRRLWGRGIGHADASLLASCLLAPGTALWTRDRRLAACAAEAGVAAEAGPPAR